MNARLTVRAWHTGETSGRAFQTRIVSDALAVAHCIAHAAEPNPDNFPNFAAIKRADVKRVSWQSANGTVNVIIERN